MSKYKLLWDYINNCKQDIIKLSFDEIENILGFPIDHSFLKYKKELIGYDIKISLKEKTIVFKKSNV